MVLREVIFRVSDLVKPHEKPDDEVKHPESLFLFLQSM